MTWQTEPDAGPVENNWEQLDQTIWWTGRQWAVTGYGIERRDGAYTIEAAALGDRRTHPSGEVAEWPVHIAIKVNFDHDDFMKAFLIALAVHQGRYTPLPEGWLGPTLEAIRDDERGGEEFDRILRDDPA